MMSVGGALVLQSTNSRLGSYRTAEENISKSLKATSSIALQRLKRQLQEAADKDRIIHALFSEHKSAIESHLEALWDLEKKKQRSDKVSAKCAHTMTMLTERLNTRFFASPAVRAERAVLDAIQQLNELILNANRQLEERRKRLKLTWWFDLNRPKFETADARIRALEVALQQLRQSGDIQNAAIDFRARKECSRVRLTKVEKVAHAAIPPKHQDWFDEDRILQKALLLSTFSISVSAWRDTGQAGSVYDSLRAVNGNYADMSDADIWLETLTMSGPELAGLAHLTKGALFEKHVATETGGQLHEHFNHPDTDIIIDGLAYQIKATESEAYINQVSDHIPVISTSEIAESTGSIDVGYSNQELVQAIDLALGGTVIDFSDTGLDAVLTGIGGVGIFAIISGARSGLEKYRRSGDAVDAAITAVGQTVKVTIRQGVMIAEILTKGTAGIVRLAFSIPKKSS